MTAPRNTSRRRSRGAASVLAAWLSATVALAGCGLPGHGQARTVKDDDVPYRLLEPATPSADSSGRGTDGQPAALLPRLFWILDSGLLEPGPVEFSCAEAPRAAVAGLLLALSAGPSDDARARGLSTAIPPDSELALADLADRTAEVEIDPASPISADRLPAAVGQIVLTLTSARGVTSVLFVDADTPVPVPLPGGALTEAPVTADDYSQLLPDRYRIARAIGCTEP